MYLPTDKRCAEAERYGPFFVIHFLIVGHMEIGYSVINTIYYNAVSNWYYYIHPSIPTSVLEANGQKIFLIEFLNDNEMQNRFSPHMLELFIKIMLFQIPNFHANGSRG